MAREALSDHPPGGEVEANHIARLRHEIRVGGELEGFQAMRLQAEGAPDPLYRGNRQAAGPRHAARTPLRGVRRHALQRAHDDGLDPRVLDSSGRTRARLVPQTVEAMLDEAPAPLADRRRVDLQPCCHLLVLNALGAD